MLESSSNTINHSNVKRNNKENKVSIRVFDCKKKRSTANEQKKTQFLIAIFPLKFAFLQTISEAMTIPISSLSNQNNSNNLVNSVIQQTNQQSVIQSTGGSSVQVTSSKYELYTIFKIKLKMFDDQNYLCNEHTRFVINNFVINIFVINYRTENSTVCVCVCVG